MSEPLVFTFTSAIKEGKLKEYEHAESGVTLSLKTNYVGGFSRLPAL